MSLEDIKKLPRIECLVGTSPIVAIAEIETTSDWYGQKQHKRLPVYVKGVYRHPLIDEGKDQLVYEPTITTIRGRTPKEDSRRQDINIRVRVEDLVDYTILKSL